jgi:flagellar biogenesis protein FliO
MLFLALTSHDVIYLVTKLGALALVLFACWLVPKLDHQHNAHL